MTHQRSEDIANRFTLAAAELLQHPLDPQFEEDMASALFLAGDPLDGAATEKWSDATKQTGLDLIHLAFQPGRERFGPTDVSVFAERYGVVMRWTGCVMWAPKDGGPLLIMPPKVNVCFAHDGKALLSFPVRPTQALSAGVERARHRLRRAAWSMTDAELRAATAFRQAV